MKKVRKILFYIFTVVGLFVSAFVVSSCGECKHEWSEYTIVKEATCTEKGEQSRTCSKCNGVENATIDALGHTEVVDVAVAPTCTEKGKSEGSHCSVCNEVLVAQEEVAATGHKGGVATETEKAICEVCNQPYGELKEPQIPDHKHEATGGYKYDGTHHWKECACGAPDTKEDHNYNVSNTDEKYLNSSATCVAKATYFYSCICGAKGETTFEVGEVSETHNYGDYVYNGNGTHSRVCSLDNSHVETENCTNTAVCEKCNNSNCTHDVLSPQLINLKDYGACEGLITYNSCACGENVSINPIYEFIKTSCDIEDVYDEHHNYDDYEEGICKECGLHLIYASNYTIVNCVETQQLTIKISIGETSIIDITFDITSESHSYELDFVTYEGLDACIIVSVCKDCGESEYETRYSSCDLKVEGEPSIYTDEDGTKHNVVTLACLDCDFNVKIDSLERKEGCLTYLEEVTTYYYGQELIYTHTELDDVISNHKLTSKTSLVGQTCEEGWLIEVECNVCDIKESIYMLEHSQTVDKEFYLGDYNLCDGTVTIYDCVCDRSTMVDYQFSCNFAENTEYKVIDGVDHAIRTYTCSECGLVTVLDVYNIVNDCVTTTYCTYTLNFSDTETYTCTVIQRVSSSHDYEYSYTLMGETCEDGVKVNVSCNDCDYTEELIEDYHNTSYDIVYFDEEKTCGGYYFANKCDVCEKVVYQEYLTIYCDVNSPTKTTYTDENEYVHTVNTYICGECDLTYIEDVYEYEQTCSLVKSYNYIVYVGEEKIYDEVSNRSTSTHNYDNKFYMYGESCEDGYAYIHKCLTCGEYDYGFTEDHVELEYDKKSLAEYGADAELIYTKCLCEGFKGIEIVHDCSDVGYEESYVEEDGVEYYIETITCEACKLVYTYKRYSIKEECLVKGLFDLTVNVNGTVIIDGETYLSSSYTEHEYEHSYSLTSGSTTCEDGVTIYENCKSCDYERIDTIDGHELLIREEIDLSTYGACDGGVIYAYSCVCGEHIETNLNENCNGTYNDYSEEIDGVTYEVYEFECSDCGFSYANKYHYEVVGCTEYKYETVNAIVNETVVISKTSYNYTSDAHNYEITYSLVDESCEDGVNVTVTCTKCNYSYSYDYDYHNCVNETTIKVKDTHEECCGIEIEVYECICKEKVSIDWYSVDCYLNSDSREYTDTEEYDHYEVTYTCEYCDVKVVEDTKYVVDSLKQCITYSYISYSFYYGSELVYEKLNLLISAYENHTLVYTHAFENDQDCENGVTIYENCQYCDYNYSSTSCWHEPTYATKIDISEYSTTCEGNVIIITCPCGKTKDVEYEHYYNNEWVYMGGFVEGSYEDSLGVTHTTETYSCPHCDFNHVTDYWEEKDENEDCYFTKYRIDRFYYGTTLITENNKYEWYSYYIHNFTTTYQFVDKEDCDYGITVINTCSECGTVEEETHYDHYAYVDATKLDLSTLNCGGYLETGKCPCGENVYFDDCSNCTFNYVDSQTDTDAQGNEHGIYTEQCINCGLTKIKDSKYVVEGCYTYVYVIYTYTYNSKTVFTSLEYLSATGSDHNEVVTATLNDGATSCEEGWSSITTCSKCNDLYQEDTYDHHDYSIVEEVINISSYIENCSETYTYTHCLCGLYGYLQIGALESYDLVTTKEKVDGVVYTTETLTYSDYDLVYIQKTYSVVENCVENKYLTFEIKINGEVVKSSEKYIIIESPESHEFEYTPIFEGEKDCEQGVYYEKTCKNCDYYYEGYEWVHSYHILTKIELINYDGCCGGQIYEYSCLCGKDITSYIESDCDVENSEEMFSVDSLGFKHKEITYSCKTCELTWTEDYRYVPTEQDCLYDLLLTRTVYYGDELVIALKEHNYGQQTQHNYEFVYELSPTANSCAEGVYEYSVCSVCGYRYESNYFEGDTHYFNDVSVDVSNFEVCDGFEAHNGYCVCGKEYKGYYSLGCNCEHTYQEVTGDDGYEHYIHTQDCNDCGLVVVEDFRYVIDTENSIKYTYVTFTIKYNDDVIATFEDQLNSTEELV